MNDWKKYFIISGCDHFVLPGIGEFKANAENIAEDKLLKAYQLKCPFIGLTEEGCKKYDPEKQPIKVNLIQHKSIDQVIERSRNEGNPLKKKKNTYLNPLKPQ